MSTWHMVYVAGASSERERASAVIGALEKVGIGVTYDWTCEPLARGDRESGVGLGERIACAERADAIVLIVPHGDATTIVAWVELGAAISQGVPVIVVGEPPIFAEIGDVFMRGASTPDEIARAAARLLHIEIEDPEEDRAQALDEADYARSRGV